MKTISILFMLIFVLPVIAGTFKDSFEDGNLDGWEEVKMGPPPINWWLDEGQIIFSCGFNTAGRQVLRGVITDDVTIEFDAKMEEAFEHIVGIDCILRLLDSDHDIFFNIGRWNNRLASAFCVWWDGKDEVYNETPFPFEIGKWYHIKGMVKDKEYTFYIDGKKISNHKSDKAAKGKVGFGGGGNGCKIIFDNVIISGPDIPDAGPNGYSIESKNRLATTWGMLKCR